MADSSKSELDDSRYIVPALERGLLILSQFTRERRQIGAPELSQRLQLPRSTVFRLLNTLESMGFVERTENGREYKLGLGVLRLGFEYLASLDLTELGTPLINRLCQQLGYPANLVVRDGRHIVYVAKATSSSAPFIGSVSVGTRLPAHGTVLGHVLLSGMTLAQLKELYPEVELERFSSQTPVDVSELYQSATQISKQGYVAGEGFYESHISTVAAPVFNHSGHVVAALGVTLGAPQIEQKHKQMLIDSVCEVASELSALLDYAPAMQRHWDVPLRAVGRSVA
ncbi:IclR family transcriptional regulator [Vandammella animalimorsus]|uniref:IclR family transcriptional regulator n=1 Tax=Vandammella animalimorsus TaxID=2029117 RepID=A0A2A2A990_9BURK|nr:IclR family transcriptional regulator [Vandammella animalimorsus]PAT35085.1 IclR family transcriptional regulator [Vandammella animalimorsus]